MIDPITAGIAVAGAQAVGGLIGGLFGSRNTRETNSANAALAAQNNATQIAIAEKNNQTMIDLSNTQYQRGVKDMKAAGINPIMAASKGISGGGVPNLQMPQLNTPIMQNNAANIQQSWANSANAAVSGFNTMMQMQEQYNRNTINPSQVKLIDAQAKNYGAQTGYIGQQTATEEWKTKYNEYLSARQFDENQYYRYSITGRRNDYDTFDPSDARNNGWRLQYDSLQPGFVKSQVNLQTSASGLNNSQSTLNAITGEFTSARTATERVNTLLQEVNTQLVKGNLKYQDAEKITQIIRNGTGSVEDLARATNLLRLFGIK